MSIDSTSDRAHPHAEGARFHESSTRTEAQSNYKDLPGEPADHPLGCSWGGWTTKIHALTDACCSPITMLPTAGQAGDNPMLERLVAAHRVRARCRVRPRAWSPTRPAVANSRSRRRLGSRRRAWSPGKASICIQAVRLQASATMASQMRFCARSGSGGEPDRCLYPTGIVAAIPPGRATAGGPARREPSWSIQAPRR